MIEEIKAIKSGKRELRRFGVTLSVVLLVWAGVALWRGKDWYFFLGVGSCLCLLCTFTFPRSLVVLHVLLTGIVILLTQIVTCLVLFIFFYAVITPVGVLARIFGKQFLGLERKKEASTYWIPREKRESQKERCEAQF
jgi:hypothetical protein